jgi:hypothetical protein
MRGKEKLRMRNNILVGSPALEIPNKYNFYNKKIQIIKINFKLNSKIFKYIICTSLSKICSYNMI